MEILDGLYRLRKPRVIEEHHGGAVLKSDVYWFIAIYGEEVGLYGSGPSDHRRYFSKKFELLGHVVKNESSITFVIRNPLTKGDVTLDVFIGDSPESLFVKGYDEEGSPWLEGVFDRVVSP